ncbi:MAG: DUF1579 domain-containing protein [Pirellulales bacterium]
MRNLIVISFAACCVLACSLAHAQPMPEFPAPTEQHQWLEKFVGQWDITSKGMMGPDQPPMECSAVMKSKMLGGFWVVTETDGETPGGKFTSLQTIGYDPAKQVYVGTWVDSMTNHLWHYEGSVDESGKTLTLEAEGPNFMTGGATAKFRDSYEFKSPDEIIARSSIQGEDGKWITFMTGTATRKE